MKDKTKKEFYLGKILILIGALWIIVFSVLHALEIYTPHFYKWEASWQGMAAIGLFYIFIPFSVKPEWWSRIWAILIGAVSVILIIGTLVGDNIDYNSVWTYVNILPHFLMSFGCLLWAIKG